MTGSNILYELPRPILAKVVHIGGIGMQFKHAKPLTGVRNGEKILQKKDKILEVCRNRRQSKRNICILIRLCCRCS